MRSILYIFTFTGLLIAKNIDYKTKVHTPKVLMSSQGAIETEVGLNNS